MKQSLERVAGYLGKENLWMAEVFVVVLATLIAAVIVSVFLRKLLVRAERTSNAWDDALFGALLQPARWMVWAVGLSWAAQIAAAHADAELALVVPDGRRLATIIIFTWFVVGAVGRLEKSYIAPRGGKLPIDQTTVLALGKLVRVSVFITAILVALQSLGYSIAGVLAFGGIGGIAVGFAAKDLLANFFGGLTIYLDRPFVVGEWIRSPDKDIEGTVEDIGWRLTRIRTFDKRPLYVPNSTFSQISVENPSRMTNRRIFETVGVRYTDADKVEAIISAVRKMIESHPQIDATATIIVNFNTFAASSLDFMVYCFTKTTDWVIFHQVKQDVLLQVIAIIDNHGAQCAFPTSTVHLASPVQLEDRSEQATRLPQPEERAHE